MTRKRLLLQYTIQQTLHWFTAGLIIPVIALLLLEKGLDLFQIGLSIAVLSGTVIALELPTGGLADSIGRKKVYLYSLLFNAIGIMVLLFASSFLTVLAGFIFLGAARALSSGSMDAWFVDEFHRIEPAGDLQRALAAVGVFVPLGVGAGSLIGGILPDTLGRVLARMRYLDVYSSNLLAMALLVVIQAIYTALAIKEHQRSQSGSEGESGLHKLPRILATSIAYGIKNRVVLILLASTAALGFAVSGLENFWQPQLKSIIAERFQTWLFGILSAGYFLSASIGSLIVTPVCRLFGKRYTGILFAARICMAAVWFVLALQKTIAGFSVFYIVIFLFNGLSTSPHATILNREIPAAKRSTLMSFESLTLQLGAVIGSIFMGYIAQRQSIAFAWYIGSVILFLSSIFYLLIPKANNAAQ